MHPLPHQYRVRAEANTEGAITHPHERLPELRGNAPVEFDGPGNEWSPEELLTAAVADCFVLSFRAVARASSLAWTSLSCDVEGTLERVDRANRFTRFVLAAHLVVPEGVDHDRADRLLHKAESICLVTNSMTAERVLQTTVATG